jgi:rubredoxin
MVFGKPNLTILKEVSYMTNWKCENCGYMFEAEQPPDTCPSCKEKCQFLDNTCYTPDCEADGLDKRIG